MEAVKLAILRWLHENYDDLLKLDLSVARLFGAPAPHTISSYAYQLDREGNRLGKVLRPLIDALFKWLKNEQDHCLNDYLRVKSS